MSVLPGHVITIMQKNLLLSLITGSTGQVVRFRETDPLWGKEQFLFPIVQGGTFDDLRKISAEKIASARTGRKCNRRVIGRRTC